MKPYESDKDIAEMTQELKPLVDVYATVGADQITKEQFEQILKLITDVRTKVTQ